jgi:hypothetical protein
MEGNTACTVLQSFLFILYHMGRYKMEQNIKLLKKDVPFSLKSLQAILSYVLHDFLIYLEEA